MQLCDITISYITRMEYRDDDEFANAFETCRLSSECFHHRDHIRLAWIYLQRYGESQARPRIAAAIRNFAAHHGKSDKYHETLTVAWLRLVANAMTRAPLAATFEHFTASAPELLDQHTVQRYYSAAAISSDAARTTYVEPDLQPLPWAVSG